MTTEPQLYRYKHLIKMSACNTPNEEYVVLITPTGNQFAITKEDFKRDYEPVEPTCKQSLQVDGWKPISEFPKNDGDQCDLWVFEKDTGESFRITGCWWSEVDQSFVMPTRPKYYGSTEYINGCLFDDYICSHFMPLPAPPREDK